MLSRNNTRDVVEVRRNGRPGSSSDRECIFSPGIFAASTGGNISPENELDTPAILPGEVGSASSDTKKVRFVKLYGFCENALLELLSMSLFRL